MTKKKAQPARVRVKREKTRVGRKKTVKMESGFITGIPGLDKLFEKGIPKGASVIIAGGTGSGKTILGLQILAHHARQGKNCLYMSFEEREEKLKSHMNDFGWDPESLVKSGRLKIKRYSPFEIARSVEAVLAKEKGELLIDLEPIILQESKKFDVVILDSLSAVASTFGGREEVYRVYVEQLFRLFEKVGSTNFFITETKEVPDVFSTTGVEEFLADGVIVIYHARRGTVREKAIEVLKMRGAKHEKRIVAMQITDKGIVVYPEQEVFGLVDQKG